MTALFDHAHHEALAVDCWDTDRARDAIARICASAEAEFDESAGAWRTHPLDGASPEPRSINLYWGATGVAWALGHLAAVGAARPRRDYGRWIEDYPERVRQEAAHEQHGSASYFFGEAGALLLAWQRTRRRAFADRLHLLVQQNRHNPVDEPLWGNAGTVLAAIRMAEEVLDAEAADEAGRGGARNPDRTRWAASVAECLEALAADMVVDPESGTWVWMQDLYGKRSRHLGAGHGLAGNAYAFLRGARFADADMARRVEDRVRETLAATAMRSDGDADFDADADADTPTGIDSPTLINWHVAVDSDRLATWASLGRAPLVQDCHGAPGIVCRLAGMPRTPAWDALLRGGGELAWNAGPLAKGPSLCHGTAGSAMACLKLWRRFGDPLWLDRARRLALHAADQVEAARVVHGQGRHSLWTGDLGVACTLWNCLVEDDRFPTLDHF